MADLTKLSSDELDAKQHKITEKIDALRDERREIQAEVDRRALLGTAGDLVAGLTDEQRKALAQMVAPGGIPSTAAVGTPE